jgi:hypothetical protein
MNINESYDFVIDKIYKMRETGIQVTITNSECRYDQHILDKYDKPGILPVDKWVHVSFYTGRKENDLQTVLDTEYLFRMMGITFDTGYGIEERDWELDWCFKTT